MNRLCSLLLCLALLAALAVPALAVTVVRSGQSLRVDGAPADCTAYNIDGYNYFRLRDLAGLLNGTDCRFNVVWDAGSGTVRVLTGEAYDASGDTPPGREDLSHTAVRSSRRLEIDGETVSSLSVYNIGGSNFFKLAELQRYLGYALDYDEESRCILLDTELPEPDGGAGGGAGLAVKPSVGVYSVSDNSMLRDSGAVSFPLGSLRSAEYAAFRFLTKNTGDQDLFIQSAYARVDGGPAWSWSAFTLKAGQSAGFHLYQEAMSGLLPGAHTVEFYLNDRLEKTQTFTLLRPWGAAMSLPGAAQRSGLHSPSRSPYIVCEPQFEGVTGFVEYSVDLVIDEAPRGTYVSIYDWDMDLSSLRQSYKAVWREYQGTAAYAGFQVLGDGSHHVIFSAWDTYCQDAAGNVYTIRPKVIYPEGAGLRFDGEGNGTQCILPFDWKEDHPYRALLQQSRNEQTGTALLSFWVCDLETGVWTRLIEYDLGYGDTWMIGGMAFLENYLTEYAGELRTMELSNFRVRTRYGDVVPGKSARFAQNYEYPGSYNFGSDGRNFWAITTGVAGCCTLPPDWQTYQVSQYATASPY